MSSSAADGVGTEARDNGLTFWVCQASELRARHVVSGHKLLRELEGACYLDTMHPEDKEAAGQLKSVLNSHPDVQVRRSRFPEPHHRHGGTSTSSRSDLCQH